MRDERGNNHSYSHHHPHSHRLPNHVGLRHLGVPAMTERLIDAVCPHCGRVGTTVRVVLHEDGYTKLSRRCTDCGGECIHTFDHDWLSVARNQKLQAENERLLQAVGLATTAVPDLEIDIENPVGMMQRVVAEFEKQRAENERLTRERDNAREAVEFLLTKDLSQRFAIRYQTSAGCMCPAEANLHCQNSFCPRRNPPGIITCQGGKP